MKKKEKSIFRTILTAMLMVLGIEILLLVAALSISHVSSQLDQNAVDILKNRWITEAVIWRAFCLQIRIFQIFQNGSMK